MNIGGKAEVSSALAVTREGNMDAKVVWKSGMSFDGSGISSGFTLPIGTSAEFGGKNDGFRPMELLLVGLAGCTAMDVISILEKKHQDVTGLEVRVHGERGKEHPRVFTDITIEFLVTGRNIDQAAVERAIELSSTRYCSAEAMLNKVARIDHKITILESEMN
jgi:putative redox protein